jgi:nitrilase
MFNYESLPIFKAAAVQAGMILKDPPEWFDSRRSLQKALSLIEEAARNGAQLIVFPETWLPGHPQAVFSMGKNVHADYQDVWVEYLKQSIEVPSPEVDVLCKAARKAEAYVVIGINERDNKYYGQMYNTILFMNPRGELMGKHRKISNTVTERLFHCPGQGGDNLRTVFPTELGHIGGSICNEHSQYLLQYYWVLQGMDVHCSLWPGMVVNKSPMQARVRGVSSCSAVFSVAACSYIPMKDYPAGYRARNEANTLCGGSGICSPQGEYIIGPVFDEETILYADIDLSEIPRKRASVNLTGLYNRWDLLSLNVREKDFEPVRFMDADSREAGPDLLKKIRQIEEILHNLEAALAAISSTAGNKEKP